MTKRSNTHQSLEKSELSCNFLESTIHAIDTNPNLIFEICMEISQEPYKESLHIAHNNLSVSNHCAQKHPPNHGHLGWKR